MGVYDGSTTIIPLHLAHTPVIPREPELTSWLLQSSQPLEKKYQVFFNDFLLLQTTFFKIQTTLKRQAIKRFKQVYQKTKISQYSQFLVVPANPFIGKK
jgi:hypothetical protein